MSTTWTRQALNAANEAISTSSPSTEWSRIQIVSSAGGGNLTINDVDYITDSTGTGSLLNIDALDATTEATIESAIDTLTNLTIQTSLNVVGTANLDAVDIDGNVQLDGTLTVGVDGTSYDVKFFGDDPGNFMLWDQSENKLEIRNDSIRAGLLLSNTDAGATNSPAIDYYRNSASAAASDVLGITTYKGRNADNDADVIYARLQSSILDATKGSEEGQFKLGVMANGVFRQDGITLAGQSDGTVDVTLGNSTAATTNIAGDLTILGGNITNAITFDAGISNTGTITGGTWNGTAIADSYIASASTWNSLVTNATHTGDVTGATTLTIADDAVTYAKMQNITADRMLGRFDAGGGVIKELSSNEVRSFLGIGGITNAKAVVIDAADVADDDYARFTANGLEGRTLAEIKSDIGTGNSALVPSAGTSGHFLKHDGTFGQVAYSNISGTPTIPANFVTNDADDIMLGSLNLKKVSDDATARSLIFEKNRATSVSAQDDDKVGLIEFKAYNDGGTPALLEVASIVATITDVTDNNECGKLDFRVLPIDDYGENNEPSVGLTLEGTTGLYGHVNVSLGTAFGTVRHNSYNNIFAGNTTFTSGRIHLEPSNPSDVNSKSIFKMEAYNDADDIFKVEVDVAGETTISTNDDGGAAAHLNIEPDGHVEFDGCGVGFDRIYAPVAADVTVDFRIGNKAHLDMTGANITGTLTLQFPAVSGNFVLVVQQDGTARTINAYATKDAAGNAGNNDGGTAGAVRWAGGSVPDLTDGGNKRDVLSFYWDADEEVCYGVASLNFYE